MTDNRVLLDAAAFMDSPQAASLSGIQRRDVREITQRFLASCYQGIAKAPRLLEGDDVATLMQEILPRQFGVRDPLAIDTELVLEAYLQFLVETETVPAQYEQRQALSAHAEAFRSAVSSGAAHAEGIAPTGKVKTITHRADKVGRNDPCPCGSGRKFKKCCMSLGGKG